MTQTSYFWDGLATGDAVQSRYGSDALAMLDRLKFQPYPERQSVLGSNCLTCTGLQVSAGGAGWSDIAIAVGYAMVNGRYYSNTAVVTLNMTLNVGSWWSVVLRSDTAARSIRLALKGPYISESAALNAVVQNEDMWEVVIATVLQGVASPTVYDQRVRTVRNNYVNAFVPAVSGYNTTHSTYLQHRSSMGWAMPNDDSTYVGAQFMFSYDLWDDLTVQPIVIPLGTPSPADIYIRDVLQWGAIGEHFDVNSAVVGYSAVSVINQILNLPLSSVFTTAPTRATTLVTITFSRDATNILDTFNGTIYCPGFRLSYISYTR